MLSTGEKLIGYVANRSRPLRRRLFPTQFKEWYANQLLDRRTEATYFEIGIRSGESFRLARAKRRIGVDPVRTEAMSVLLEGEEFFEMTSDEFFGGHASVVLKRSSVDVALIDGYHEFRQVVRDFLNIEPYMRSDGFILLDDFNPPSAERAQQRPTGGAWNGDVWKLAPFLAAVRQDLEYLTVDADEGIGIVRGFGRKPSLDYRRIIDDCKDLEYSFLDADRKALLHLVSPRQALKMLGINS